MKYFIFSDVHGYYSMLKEELLKYGYDENNEEHMLISLGDNFDRGPENFKMYDFLKEMKEKKKIIIVKGNHEDLFLDMLYKGYSTHIDERNGTYKTLIEFISKYFDGDPYDMFYYNAKDVYYKLRDEGIYAAKFNPLKAIVSVRYNNRDHRKITVIDGEVGFISGANISDEYINEVELFGTWKDNALMMKGKCVDSLVYMFLELYNFASIKHLLAKDFLCVAHKIYKEEGFVAPYGDGPRPIYEDYIGMNVYLNIINQAKKYIYISTPYLIVEHEFIQALINASKRGVDIKIITPEIPDKRVIKVMTKSNYFELIKAGIKIYEFKGGFIHAKTILSDDQYGVVGTINFDYRSFVHHFECCVWLYKCHCLNDIKSDFNDLFDTKTTEININKAKLNIFERVVNIFLGAVSPLL